MKTNLTAKFRAALKNEIPIWLEKGILSESSANQLREDYQLDNLASESSRMLAAVLFTLGGLLLGGGVISFVAASWDEIPRDGKVVLLLTTMTSFYATGYWLRSHRDWPRLGHALIFAGCLIFGANIGLFAQIFHISGEWYGAFGIWALGSLVMAWAASSWIVGALTILTSFIWLTGFSDDHSKAASIYPFVVAASLLPLAWRLGSRALYTMTFLCITAALCVIAGNETNRGMYVMLAMASGGVLCWAVGEAHRASGIREEFGNPTAGLGIITLFVGAYFWSFREMWQPPYSQSRVGFTWLIPALVATITGIALMVRCWSRSRHHRLILCIQSAALLLFVSVTLHHFDNTRVILPTIGVNIAALLLVSVVIWSGIVEERRIAFWAGSLLGMLIIVARFFEYESSLLLKSAVFIACGAAIMQAGMAYERSLRRSEVVQ